jgi:small ligand-binding sensory domain FIST
MPNACGLSTAPQTAQAVDEACSTALEGLQGSPDLAMVFFSSHHGEAAKSLASIQARLGARCLLGCSGESIVGGDQEIEEQPALSVWVARWPWPINLTGFHIDVEKTADGYSLLGWPDDLSDADADASQSAMLLLGDPFTFPVDACLTHLNEAHSGLPVMGGMASGGSAQGQHRHLLNNQFLGRGAIGVLLRGPVGIRSIVSQGCRPIGRHMVITRGKENVIAGLGGKPPLAQLQELWEELDAPERDLLQHGLHVGCVINEYQDKFERGDFLVRNILGLDHDSGSIAINDQIRVGQTVQFHVRDAATADEDLRALLLADLHSQKTPPSGALLFTCNGRGTRLFSQPHHDVQALHSTYGKIPVAGFFAQGELGPVGGKNFIHGFTASVALFEN